jgi:hypothetical protein
MDGLLIARNSQSNATIVVPSDASPNVLETAHDLADTIAKMSGATLPVVFESSDGPRLVLGAHDRDRSLPPLAYHVWRDDDRVYFSGGSDQGVSNGVYAFEKSQDFRVLNLAPQGEKHQKKPPHGAVKRGRLLGPLVPGQTF